MLEMRPDCERCGRDLAPDARDARICSFECTFCADCVDGPLAGVCPNCGGNFAAPPAGHPCSSAIPLRRRGSSKGE